MGILSRPCYESPFTPRCSDCPWSGGRQGTEEKDRRALFGGSSGDTQQFPWDCPRAYRQLELQSKSRFLAANERTLLREVVSAWERYLYRRDEQSAYDEEP